MLKAVTCFANRCAVPWCTWPCKAKFLQKIHSLQMLMLAGPGSHAPEWDFPSWCEAATLALEMGRGYRSEVKTQTFGLKWCDEFIMAIWLRWLQYSDFESSTHVGMSQTLYHCWKYLKPNRKVRWLGYCRVRAAMRFVVFVQSTWNCQGRRTFCCLTHGAKIVVHRYEFWRDYHGLMFVWQKLQQIEGWEFFRRQIVIIRSGDEFGMVTRGRH